MGSTVDDEFFSSISATVTEDDLNLVPPGGTSGVRKLGFASRSHLESPSDLLALFWPLYPR